MYERMLLESGKVFEGRRVSSIGAQIVDDSRTIHIYVSIPEGVAEIVSVTAPTTFTPGVAFNITIQVRNDGGDDHLFVRLTDTDTGTVLKDYTSPAIVPSGTIWSHTMNVTLTQTTDFNGLIEAGHIE